MSKVVCCIIHFQTNSEGCIFNLQGGGMRRSVTTPIDDNAVDENSGKLVGEM